MKIAKVETFPLAIPYEHGGPQAAWGGRPWQRLNTLAIRVETDDGLVGWGESFSYNCLPAVKAMIDQTVAPIAVGREVGGIAAFMWGLQKDLHLFGRYGVTIFALSGLDIALWDLAAKAAGQPLARLLGGDERRRLPGYASLLKYDDPDLVREHTRRALGMGFPAVKLHETTVEAMAAARDAAGAGVPICVDVNCPWAPQEALAMAMALRPYEPYWFEEPVFPPEDFRSRGSSRRVACR